jgi:hypothetical protein
MFGTMARHDLVANRVLARAAPSPARRGVNRDPLTVGCLLDQ